MCQNYGKNFVGVLITTETPITIGSYSLQTGRKGGMGRKWSQKKGKVAGRKQEMGDEMISSASTEILDWTNVLVKLSA